LLTDYRDRVDHIRHSRSKYSDDKKNQEIDLFKKNIEWTCKIILLFINTSCYKDDKKQLFKEYFFSLFYNLLKSYSLWIIYANDYSLEINKKNHSSSLADHDLRWSRALSQLYKDRISCIKDFLIDLFKWDEDYEKHIDTKFSKEEFNWTSLDEKSLDLMKRFIFDSTYDWGVDVIFYWSDMPQARTVRDMLLDVSKIHNIIKWIVWLNSERAWSMREQYLSTNKSLVVKSLAWLDTKRARDMRNSIIEMWVPEVDLLYSITWLDSEEAREIRDKYLFYCTHKNELLVSLCWLDSKRARDMREKIISLEFRTLDVCRSIAWLDSDKARAIRESLLKKGETAVAISLVWLDTNKAWRIRKTLYKRWEKEKESIILDQLLEGLAGVSSLKSYDIRWTWYAWSKNLLSSYYGTFPWCLLVINKFKK